MTYKNLVILFLLASGLIACNNRATETSVIKNDIDSISYYTGVYTAWTVRDAGSRQFNSDAFFMGLNQQQDSTHLRESLQEANFQIGKILDRYRAAQAEKNLSDGKAYLDKNKSRKEINVTPSGLQYEILKEGKGAKPAEDDSVSILYKGILMNGNEFVGTTQNTPQTFSLSQADGIKGWLEALKLMRVGSHYKFYIPTALAFGDKPPSLKGLKPNMPVIFEIEMIASVSGKSRRPLRK